QGSCGCGAFEKSPDANKMPALAVAHCRIGYALKKIYFFLHTVEEFMWFRKPHLFHTGSLHLQEEAVELFPPLRTDLLDYLPRIAGSGSSNRDCRQLEKAYFYLTARLD